MWNTGNSSNTSSSCRRLYTSEEEAGARHSSGGDHIPFLPGSLSADGDSLYAAKLSFYENGAAYFAWLNEDLRRQDEQIFMKSMYTEMNSEDYHERESSFK